MAEQKANEIMMLLDDVDAGVDLLLEELKRYREQEKWHPIETAPKDGTIVLGCKGKNVFSMQWDEDYGLWLIMDEDGIPFTRTAFGTDDGEVAWVDPNGWKPMIKGME